MQRRPRSFVTTWHDQPPNLQKRGTRPSLNPSELGTSTRNLLHQVPQLANSSPKGKVSVPRAPSKPKRSLFRADFDASPKEQYLVPAQPTIDSIGITSKKANLLEGPRRHTVAGEESAHQRALKKLNNEETKDQTGTNRHSSAVTDTQHSRIGPTAKKPLNQASRGSSTNVLLKPRITRQRTEALIRDAVNELAQAPVKTRRLTIEKRSSLLLEALHKSGGTKFLQDMASKNTTLVTMEDSVEKDRTYQNISSYMMSFRGTNPLAPRVNQIGSDRNEESDEDGNESEGETDGMQGRLKLSSARSTMKRSSQRRLHSGSSNGMSNSPQAGKRESNQSEEQLETEEAPVESARVRVIRKLRLVGRMAVVMRNYRLEAEEKLRLDRIEKRWNLVRQIAKASLAILHMRKGVTDGTQGTWFEDYPKLRKNLLTHPAERSPRDIQEIALELANIRTISEYNIPLPDRIRIAQSAELEVCPSGQAIFHQNDEGSYFYIILAGKVSIQVRDTESLSLGYQDSSDRLNRSRRGTRRRSSSSNSVSRRASTSSESGSLAMQRGFRPRTSSQGEKRQGNIRGTPESGRRGTPPTQDRPVRHANLETRIFGEARAAELNQSVQHHAKRKNQVTFTEVAVLRAGQSFGGLGLRTVALGKRKASAIAAEYTEMLRIDAVSYRDAFMSHEMELISKPAQFIKDLPHFAGLSEDEVTQLAYSVRIAQYASGSVIFRQGFPVDDTKYFGIVKVGRCRRIKLIQRNGEDPSLEDLHRIAGDDQVTSSTNELYEYTLGSVGPGGILAEGSILADANNTRMHPHAVVAETCVEILYIARNALVFTLRNGNKFRKLLKLLPVVPHKAKLSDLLDQQHIWERFQRRFVHEILKESPRGRKIASLIERQEPPRLVDVMKLERDRIRSKELADAQNRPAHSQ